MFHQLGGHKDYVIIGSDSGRLVIIEYNPAKNTFEKVHQETFGKSGNCLLYVECCTNDTSSSFIATFITHSVV